MRGGGTSAVGSSSIDIFLGTRQAARRTPPCPRESRSSLPGAQRAKGRGEERNSKSTNSKFQKSSKFQIPISGVAVPRTITLKITRYGSPSLPRAVYGERAGVRGARWQ